ncbi:glycosyltransferase family 2 protein [Spirosoma validum]|uniref:Glycosyltransferase n=1 Tax=Spirosoma validum TaxID=2771355 RepID=A0A927GCI9_9BACT|nr:glycosyltransferase family 2 protein [Spirosoma validum]MBD2752575.1 glycosyltransferase [Spirosoma validum]
MLKLSIITVNYNNAPGLAKTIDSVIGQQCDEFEYIIIDGGSTDGSVEMIRQFESKIAYWVSEPDSGIYQAMNKGIVQAKGEYCQFLNSGDYLLRPDVTERMLTNVTPDCSILYGNKIRRYNGVDRVEKSYAGRRITLFDMYVSTLFHAPTYIKKTLFDRYGLYDETLKIVSDWKFYLIAVGLNNETVLYRDIDVVWFDSQGISSTNKALDRQEREQVLAAVLPKPILADYQEFARDLTIIRKIKKLPGLWFFILNLYRLVIRLDRYVAQER